jgi:hypothetical protein
MVQDVKNRIAEAGIAQLRKNGVLAFEVVLSASPEFWNIKHKDDGKISVKSPEEHQKWVKQSINWLKKEFGNNLVNVHLHMDEKTPHFHALVVPIDEKGKLNCRDFLGGREKLSKMQDRYSESIKDLGIDRGLSGSKATNKKLKQFYAELTPMIKEAEAKLEKLNSEIAQTEQTQAQKQIEAERLKLTEHNKLQAEKVKSIELAQREKEAKERKTIGETVSKTIVGIDYNNMPRLDLTTPDFKAQEPKLNTFGVITREEHNRVIESLKKDFNTFYNKAIEPISKTFGDMISMHNTVFQEVATQKHALETKERYLLQDIVKKNNDMGKNNDVKI